MHSIHTINTQDRSENSLFFRFFTHKLLDFTLFDVQTSQFFQDIHVYIVYTHSEHSLHTQDRRKKTPFFRLLHTYYTLVCDRWCQKTVSQFPNFRTIRPLWSIFSPPTTPLDLQFFIFYFFIFFYFQKKLSSPSLPAPNIFRVYMYA